MMRTSGDAAGILVTKACDIGTSTGQGVGDELVGDLGLEDRVAADGEHHVFLALVGVDGRLATAGASTSDCHSTLPVLRSMARTRESIEAPMKITPVLVMTGLPMVTEPHDCPACRSPISGLRRRARASSACRC